MILKTTVLKTQWQEFYCRDRTSFGSGRAVWPTPTVLKTTTNFFTAKEEISWLNRKIWSLNSAINNLEQNLEDLQEKCRPYLEAVKRFPEKVKSLIEELIRPPEKTIEHAAPALKPKKKMRGEQSR